MARSLSKIGNREKALIHVAKGQLGMSEDDYRAMLGSVGVTSSKDLDHMQFEDLMKRFEAGGFKSKNAGLARRTRRVTKDDPKAPLLRKIEAILLDRGLSPGYANGISKRMFGVQQYVWLSQEQLWKVAAALSIYVKNKKKKDEQELSGSPPSRG
jgi:phage gp16-like protein